MCDFLDVILEKAGHHEIGSRAKLNCNEAYAQPFPRSSVGCSKTFGPFIINGNNMHSSIEYGVADVVIIRT
jgi:hypothetical protein